MDKISVQDRSLEAFKRQFGSLETLEKKFTETHNHMEYIIEYTEDWDIFLSELYLEKHSAVKAWLLRMLDRGVLTSNAEAYVKFLRFLSTGIEVNKAGKKQHQNASFLYLLAKEKQEEAIYTLLDYMSRFEISSASDEFRLVVDAFFREVKREDKLVGSCFYELSRSEPGIKILSTLVSQIPAIFFDERDLFNPNTQVAKSLFSFYDRDEREHASAFQNLATNDIGISFFLLLKRFNHWVAFYEVDKLTNALLVKNRDTTLLESFPDQKGGSSFLVELLLDVWGIFYCLSCEDPEALTKALLKIPMNKFSDHVGRLSGLLVEPMSGHFKSGDTVLARLMEHTSGRGWVDRLFNRDYLSLEAVDLLVAFQRLGRSPNPWLKASEKLFFEAFQSGGEAVEQVLDAWVLPGDQGVLLFQAVKPSKALKGEPWLFLALDYPKALASRVESYAKALLAEYEEHTPIEILLSYTKGQECLEGLFLYMGVALWERLLSVDIRVLNYFFKRQESIEILQRIMVVSSHSLSIQGFERRYSDSWYNDETVNKNSRKSWPLMVRDKTNRI